MASTAMTLFQRGKTHMGPNQTIDTSDYGTSTQLEGSLRTFKDNNYGTDPVTPRSQRDVICMCVRNVSGIALLPKRTVQWQAGFEGRRVDGYTWVRPSAHSGGNFAGLPAAGVTDEFLTSAGVRNGDLFWIVVQGPSLATSTAATADLDTPAVGAIVNIATAATSQQVALAGRIEFTGITVAGTTEGHDGTIVDKIFNAVGRAKSALAAADTNSDWLINVDLLKGA